MSRFKMKNNDDDDDDDDLSFVNQNLDHLCLNDEVIRNQISLNLNSNNSNYNEHDIVLPNGDHLSMNDDNSANNDDDDSHNECNEEKITLTDLIATSLPNDLFTNEHLKRDFENMFEKYAFTDDQTKTKENVCFFYFRILKRCTVKYTNESSALNARYELDNQLFFGEPIRLFFAQVCLKFLKLNNKCRELTFCFCLKPIRLKNSRKFLEPPANQRTFLISPPASPPVGWESQLEDPPVVNLNLVAALSSLSPSLFGFTLFMNLDCIFFFIKDEPFELIESRENVPGIILHPCSDDYIETNDNKPRKFIPTRRPASDMS